MCILTNKFDQTDLTVIVKYKTIASFIYNKVTMIKDV